MTDHTLSDFQEKILQLRGERPNREFGLAGGVHSGAGTEGPRILFVDDLSEVIASFQKTEKEYAASSPPLPCRMTFFRMCDEDGGRKADFMEWLRSADNFDAIFLDGDLGSQGNGVQLAEEISTIGGLAYQPMAIFTANASFYKGTAQERLESPYRVLGKFDTTGASAMQSIVVAVDDAKMHARERFWADTQSEVATKLDNGAAVGDVANVLGYRLMKHFGVSGWYLRELRGDRLEAIAMNDGCYGAGDSLSLTETPDFLKDLALGDTVEPWSVINKLKKKDVAGQGHMIGHRGIAARVGSRVVGDLTAVLTAFREPSLPKFTDTDARQLHQLAVLLRLAMTPERTNRRLALLSNAIENVLDSESTELIIARMCDFIQEQVHGPLENRGVKTKTVARLFLRGRGEIVRWGQELRVEQGSLENPVREGIRICDETVITRVINAAETRWYLSEEEVGKHFLKVTEENIESYLIVPLIHDGAVLGAISLETGEENAYLERDRSLVEAVARVAAAAVLDHRRQRFSTELAQLSAAAVRPGEGGHADPDELIDQGAHILYRLTGFSQMLIFRPGEKPDDPWLINRGWTGGEQAPKALLNSELGKIDQFIAPRWTSTFLKHSLDRDDIDSGVHRGTEEGVDNFWPAVLGKKEWQNTWAHMVMLQGEQDNRSKAVLLMFEHPHPVPHSYDEMLAAFAQFLETVDQLAALDLGTVSSTLARLTVEAKAARALSQARHAIAGKIAVLSSAIGMGLAVGDDPVTLLKKTHEGLKETEQEFEIARAVLRVPRPECLDISSIWNEKCDELEERLSEAGFTVDKLEPGLRANADPSFVGFIFFHLLDNALSHGRRNGATEIKACAEDGRVKICDNGQELEEERMNQLFELGYTSSSKGGGHGLFIAQELAKEMGCDLVFEREGGYNCFILIYDRSI